MFKELSHKLLKKLYIQKMQALKNKDNAFLDKLQQQHPELFDKRFLYQMLQKELEITAQELPLQLDWLLQEMIKRHSKTH